MLNVNELPRPKHFPLPANYFDWGSVLSDVVDELSLCLMSPVRYPIAEQLMRLCLLSAVMLEALGYDEREAAELAVEVEKEMEQEAEHEQTSA